VSDQKKPIIRTAREALHTLADEVRRRQHAGEPTGGFSVPDAPEPVDAPARPRVRRRKYDHPKADVESCEGESDGYGEARESHVMLSLLGGDAVLTPDEAVQLAVYLISAANDISLGPVMRFRHELNRALRGEL
jgi:hypothetical protein